MPPTISDQEGVICMARHACTKTQGRQDVSVQKGMIMESVVLVHRFIYWCFCPDFDQRSGDRSLATRTGANNHHPQTQKL
jgi:hypothetical protein